MGKGTTRGTEGDAKEDGFVPGASVQRATFSSRKNERWRSSHVSLRFRGI